MERAARVFILLGLRIRQRRYNNTETASIELNKEPSKDIFF
jgi:hypothetical protein